MKHFSILFLMITSLFGTSYSQAPCSTIMPEETLEWLKNYKSSPFNSLKVSRANDFYYIPVKVHIVGDDNGVGYYKMKNLISTMCELNTQYAPVGFYFYLYGDIHYMNNSDMYDHSGYNVSSIVNANNDVAAVNMYFVKNPAGACGYFSGGWGNSKPYIAINNSCGGIGNSTVAHEVGHYFSLPHTFSGWENRSATDSPTSSDERVARTNCSSRGDYFCDTPADYISDRWNCPYTGNKVDYSGTPYNPDGALYMSYANDACQNYFSGEQIDAMIQYLNSNSRRFLLNQPVPDTSLSTAVQILYPYNEQMAVPANYALLKWDRVPGATYYFVTGTRFANPNQVSFEVLTTDTSLLVENLQAGFRYRWKVKPISPANFCAPYSDEYAFTTTQPTTIVPTVVVNPITCYGANNASIIVDPVGGVDPYEFEWSTGDVNNSLFNLSPGTYLVTITDADGSTLALNIDIVPPMPLAIDFSQSGSVVTADVTGGTPPYSYLWHNGVTGISTAVNSGQFYSVHITDSKGCTWYKDSNGVTNVEEEDALAGLKVFPNPLNGSKNLNIEFTLTNNQSVNISVIDFTGRKVVELTEDASKGTFRKAVDLSSVASGVYFVKIAAGGETLNKKVVVR